MTFLCFQSPTVLVFIDGPIIPSSDQNLGRLDHPHELCYYFAFPSNKMFYVYSFISGFRPRTSYLSE